MVHNLSPIAELLVVMPPPPPPPPPGMPPSSALSKSNAAFLTHNHVLHDYRTSPPAASAQAMSALSLTGHTLSPETLCSVLDALGPQLDRLSRPQQLQLISMLSGPGEQAPKPTTAAFLAALTHAVCSSRGGLGSAPSELLFAVVGTAARWRVPLDQGWLGEVEQELMNRLAAEGGASAAGAREQPALRQQLLSGLIRPLATLGQELRKVRRAVARDMLYLHKARGSNGSWQQVSSCLLRCTTARKHGVLPSLLLVKVTTCLPCCHTTLPLACLRPTCLCMRWMSGAAAPPSPSRTWTPARPHCCWGGRREGTAGSPRLSCTRWACERDLCVAAALAYRMPVLCYQFVLFLATEGAFAPAWSHARFGCS